MNQYPFSQNEVDRFWAKVWMPYDAHWDIDICWIWLATKDQKGYGRYGLRGKLWHAHRAAYLFHYGKCPDELYVLHSCDNPSCVNPAHLWLGTNQDNMDDKVAKGRQIRGQKLSNICAPKNPAFGSRNGAKKYPERLMRGEQCHSAKMTADKVRELRSKYIFGVTSYASLAAEYGIDPTVVGDIINRKTWKHVE